MCSGYSSLRTCRYVATETRPSAGITWSIEALPNKKSHPSFNLHLSWKCFSQSKTKAKLPCALRGRPESWRQDPRSENFRQFPSLLGVSAQRPRRPLPPPPLPMCHELHKKSPKQRSKTRDKGWISKKRNAGEIEHTFGVRNPWVSCHRYLERLHCTMHATPSTHSTLSLQHIGVGSKMHEGLLDQRVKSQQRVEKHNTSRKSKMTVNRI